ncbi:hypothetical protein LINGRAHAP2_LOCUS4556 [Linum grandiflorum]
MNLDEKKRRRLEGNGTNFMGAEDNHGQPLAKKPNKLVQTLLSAPQRRTHDGRGGTSLVPGWAMARPGRFDLR